MASKNYYDVTEWNVGNPYEDIGEVINSIIADIKSRQTETDFHGGGKPGAAIYIPAGDYHLRTQVAEQPPGAPALGRPGLPPLLPGLGGHGL